MECPNEVLDILFFLCQRALNNTQREVMSKLTILSNGPRTSKRWSGLFPSFNRSKIKKKEEKNEMQAALPMENMKRTRDLQFKSPFRTKDNSKRHREETTKNDQFPIVSPLVSTCISRAKTTSNVVATRTKYI